MALKRVIISGGGTGGHIFPAIAIADTIKNKYPNAKILFVGAEGKMEMDKVPEAGYEIIGLPIAGIQRSFSLKNILKNLMFPFKLLQSLMKASKIAEKNFGKVNSNVTFLETTRKEYTKNWKKY